MNDDQPWEIIDELIEEVELLNTKINKINFEIDGFKEELDNLSDKKPFMVRQIQQNEKKIKKLLKNLQVKMTLKDDIDSRILFLQTERKKEMAKKESSEKKTIKKTKTK
jgi:chromosome segregation ATPase